MKQLLPTGEDDGVSGRNNGNPSRYAPCRLRERCFRAVGADVGIHGTRDSVVVHLGECLEGGRILRDPGKSTIRYRRYPLALLKGTNTYRIKIKKDKRNTGSAAVLMPAYVEKSSLSAIVRSKAMRLLCHQPRLSARRCIILLTRQLLLSVVPTIR